MVVNMKRGIGLLNNTGDTTMIYGVFYSTSHNLEVALCGYVDTIYEVRAFFEEWKKEREEEGLVVLDENDERIIMHLKNDSSKHEILYVEKIHKLLRMERV
jgi:hypothetical protein